MPKSRKNTQRRRRRGGTKYLINPFSKSSKISATETPVENKQLTPETKLKNLIYKLELCDKSIEQINNDILGKIGIPNVWIKYTDIHGDEFMGQLLEIHSNGTANISYNKTRDDGSFEEIRIEGIGESSLQRATKEEEREFKELRFTKEHERLEKRANERAKSFPAKKIDTTEKTQDPEWSYAAARERENAAAGTDTGYDGMWANLGGKKKSKKNRRKSIKGGGKKKSKKNRRKSRKGGRRRKTR